MDHRYNESYFKSVTPVNASRANRKDMSVDDGPGKSPGKRDLAPIKGVHNEFREIRTEVFAK